MIADIHGNLEKLQSLIRKVMIDFNRSEDKFIFLGDYIDRGAYAFETVEFLINLSKKTETIFLKGNHEDKFLKFLEGQKVDDYLNNGGKFTVASYEKALGSMTVPREHKEFYAKLLPYYEEEDFIAVHAGLNPEYDDLSSQNEHDLLWIRDKFFFKTKRWHKTIIFGHTPVQNIVPSLGVHFDEKRNIIGLDNGAYLGHPMLCLRWPDKKVYSSS